MAKRKLHQPSPSSRLNRQNPCWPPGEDSPLNLKLALMQLERLGYHAQYVSDGQAADWHARAEQPDENGSVPVLDSYVVAGLRELQGEDGTDILQSLIEMYLHNTPERLAKLAAAIAAGDGCALEQVAHNIKGSSASFGATHLAALCQPLEELGRHGNPADAAPYLPEVVSEYQRVTAALRAEFGLAMPDEPAVDQAAG